MWPILHQRTPAAAQTAAVVIAAPRATSRGRRSRITATVDGRPVWFESRDAALLPANEAFGAALLVPAMHAGRSLHLEAPACDVWSGNLGDLAAAFRELWYPSVQPPHVVPARHRGPRGTATALCFSGGVDAFHTLLAGSRPVDLLATVIGYDMKLRERSRAIAVERLVREVAAATGLRGVVVATNLRQHPLLKTAPWVRAFGGPLAAIGHLLAGEVGRLLMSSDGLGFEHPEVGSRPGTDPLHSSAALAVEHVAARVTRLEKIRRISGEPLVQRHLRVCWKNEGDRLNCGRCEKCVRTMLSLEACGTLGRFESFDRGRGLVAAVDALPAVDDVVSTFYSGLLDAGLSGPPATAVRRLLARGAATGLRPVAPPARSVTAAAHAHRLLTPASYAHVFEPLVGKRVGYVRPDGNVGDDLIELAMVQLLAEFGIRWRLWEPDAGDADDDLDLLVFGGGGNMGSRYAGNHARRGRALASGLPLTILPQSFTGAEERPFSRVYVRETTSLTFRPDAVLAPDLALGLATATPAEPTRDVGVFLRRDKERRGAKPLLARDPAHLCRTPADYLALAARHRRIVTDRLHFAVAGLHAGRDVTLVANDYHKNRAMHETWLAALGCRFAESPLEALSARRRAA